MIPLLILLACEPEKQQEQNCAPCSGDYDITQVSDRTEIEYCSEIDGNISIIELSTNPAPLSCLETITGELSIENTALKNTNFFPNLSSVGKLIISENPSLQTLDGFEALETIQNRLQITENDVLETITGLENLKQIQPSQGFAFLDIQDNPMLLSLGLENLELVSGYISIINNDALLSLGLDSLVQINGEIIVLENDALEEFTLLSLEEVQTNLDIKYNSVLTELTLPELDSVGGHIHVFYNSSLCEAEIIGVFEQVECPEETSWENGEFCEE